MSFWTTLVVSLANSIPDVNLRLKKLFIVKWIIWSESRSSCCCCSALWRVKWCAVNFESYSFYHSQSLSLSLSPSLSQHYPFLFVLSLIISHSQSPTVSLSLSLSLSFKHSLSITFCFKLNNKQLANANHAFMIGSHGSYKIMPTLNLFTKQNGPMVCRSIVVNSNDSLLGWNWFDAPQI